MMIMHKLQQLDTTILNDFKRDYLESPNEGFAERIQMSTGAVVAVLYVFVHTEVYMIVIFSVMSLFFAGWSLYSWRTYFVLRKDGENVDEPLFIYGPVSAWRIILFIPAAIVVLQRMFFPGLFTKMVGYHSGFLYRLTDVIYPIFMSIVIVEFWRFVDPFEDRNTSRHLILVLLLALAGIALFWYIAPMHRPLTYIV